MSLDSDGKLLSADDSFFDLKSLPQQTLFPATSYLYCDFRMLSVLGHILYRRAIKTLLYCLKGLIIYEIQRIVIKQQLIIDTRQIAFFKGCRV